MTQLKTNKRLDNPNGSVEIEPNETMQPASENNESTATEKKSPLKSQGIGAKAIIAIIAVVALLTPISALAVYPVVAFIGGWAASETLSDAKQRLMDHYLGAKMATASVNGAYWVSNSYSGTSTEGDDVASNDAAIWLLGPRWGNVQVSQGHEVDDDPSGTENGVAMSAERAEAYMEEQGW